MPENLGARNMTDSVLFRKLFTKTMVRQVNAENRLHQLMMVQKGTDTTFDEYLAKVKKKVEQDGKRVQRLSKLLAVLERKEETTGKAHKTFKSATKPSSVLTSEMNQADELSKAERFDAKEHGLAAALFNIDGLGKELGFAEEKLLLEKFEHENKDCSGVLWNAREPKPQHGANIAGTQWCATDINPREIEIYFDNGSNLKNLEKHRSGRVVGSDFTDRRRTDRDVEKNTNFSTRTSQGQHLTASNKNVGFAEFTSVIADPKWSDDIYGLSRTGTFGEQISNLGEACLDSNSSHGLKVINQHRLCDEIMEEPWERERGHGFHFNSGPKERKRKDSYDIMMANRRSKEKSSSSGSKLFRGEQDRGTLFGEQETKRVTLDHRISNLSTNTKPFLNPATVSSKDRNGDTFGTTNFLNRTTEHNTKSTEWFKHRRQPAGEGDEDNDEQYQNLVNTRRDSNFVAGDTLLTMRRQSWMVHMGEDPGAGEHKKRTIIPRRISAMFHRSSFKAAQQPTTKTVLVVKGDKNEFNVKRNVRRRMSVRPLPDVPRDSDSEPADTDGSLGAISGTSDS